MSASRMPGVGDMIANRYELVEELGHGGFGVVYRARQDRKPHEVALKLMHYAEAAVGGAMDAEEFRKRFRREAIMASNLNHPHAVQQFDFGESGEVFYLSMELVRGETLAERIETRGPMSTELVAQVGYATLDVLRLAHKKDIVHRDLKPENIMLCELHGQQDFPKVLDFGAAKTMHGQHDLTVQGVALGSPAYMSPEVLMDEDPRPASDLYSLGLTLGEALVGHKIVAGKNPVERLKQQISPHPLDLPKSLIQHPLFPWLARSLEKEPTDRYASADEMLQALIDLDLDGVELSPATTSNEEAQRTELMSAVPGPADRDGHGDFTAERTVMKAIDASDGPPPVESDATELIDFDDELPDDSSLRQLMAIRAKNGQEEPDPTEEMLEVPSGSSQAFDDQQQPPQPDETTELSDDFFQAKTEALPSVGPEDNPAGHPPQPQAPSPDPQQQQQQPSTPSVQPQRQPHSPQQRSEASPQRQPKTPSNQQQRQPQQDSGASAPQQDSGFDPSGYGSFKKKGHALRKSSDGDTDITEIKATPDKDYMLVRTSDKREDSGFMQIMIIGVALMIIAAFVVYLIAV